MTHLSLAGSQVSAGCQAWVAGQRAGARQMVPRVQQYLLTENPFPKSFPKYPSKVPSRNFPSWHSLHTSSRTRKVGSLFYKGNAVLSAQNQMSLHLLPRLGHNTHLAFVSASKSKVVHASTLHRGQRPPPDAANLLVRLQVCFKQRIQPHLSMPSSGAPFNTSKMHLLCPPKPSAIDALLTQPKCRLAPRQHVIAWKLLVLSNSRPRAIHERQRQPKTRQDKMQFDDCQINRQCQIVAVPR